MDEKEALAETERSNCKKIFEEWEKNFGTEFGKPITIERLKTVKDKLTELKTANDTIISLTNEKATTQEAKAKAETELKTWTDTFGTLKPTDLPTDWKAQITKIKELEVKWNNELSDLFSDTEEKGLTAANLAELREKYNSFNSLIDPNDEEAVKAAAKNLGLLQPSTRSISLPETEESNTPQALFEVPVNQK